MINLFLSNIALANDPDLRRFYPQYEIISLLKNKFESDDFWLNKDILIFDTQIQHTWLVFYNKRLFCIIDNRKDDRPKMMWEMEISNLTKEDLESLIEVADFDTNFGIVKIGKNPVRKFSKSLFTASSLKKTIVDMMEAAKKDWNYAIGR